MTAHETDNFCLPLDSQLADLGPFLEAVHTLALEETVNQVNKQIEIALRTEDLRARSEQLEHLHDPLALVELLRRRFSHPMFEDTLLERALGGAWARDTFAGHALSHQDISMNFSAYAPIDPRRWTMLTQSRTIMAYGVYFGTDKLVHFHRLGASYYVMYRSLIDAGLSDEAAYDKVLQHYCDEGILSEKAIFGTISTGIYSNADLAVNHVGFKFFKNLTEPVVLKQEEHDPLLRRSGVFWSLNRHVRFRSGWFRPFISDHWNEALNPNRYQRSMRTGIRRILENRAEQIVEFYTAKDGRPHNPAYFNRLARDLSTYYGERYGHSGELEQLMTIGNTCFPSTLRRPGGHLN